jgi:hypothetical protein
MNATQTGDINPPADGSSIPQAVFSCSFACCREEVSYPADMLHWYAQERRWVCDLCWDRLPGIGDDCDIPTKGMSLAEHIIAGGFKAGAMLKPLW